MSDTLKYDLKALQDLYDSCVIGGGMPNFIVMPSPLGGLRVLWRDPDTGESGIEECGNNCPECGMDLDDPNHG